MSSSEDSKKCSASMAFLDRALRSSCGERRSGAAMFLPLVSRECKNGSNSSYNCYSSYGSNSSYNCSPFLHSLLTKGKCYEASPKAPCTHIVHT